MTNTLPIDENTTVRTKERSRAIHGQIIDRLVTKKKLSPELKAKAQHYAKSALSAAHGGMKREEYKAGNLFRVGDLVECDEGQAAIINLGTNYVTLMREGQTFKKWITDVRLVESSTTSCHQMLTISEDLKETFAPILEHEDQYAVFNCIKAYESLQSIENLEENFHKYKIDFDRAVRYFTKFNLDTQLLGEAEDTLLMYAMMNEIYSFNVLNESKVEEIGNQIDATIKKMVESLDTNGLIKQYKKLHENKLGIKLFEKHLKRINIEAYNIIKGQK